MRNKKKFNEFMNKTIEELKDEKRYGTAHVYQSTLNAFSEFCGCEVIYFHQLNRANLKEFETYLRDKQLEGVSKCTPSFFYAQSPDFHKLGLCYYLKILYL